MQPLALALLAYLQQKHGQKLLRGATTGRGEVITINPLLTLSQSGADAVGQPSPTQSEGNPHCTLVLMSNHTTIPRKEEKKERLRKGNNQREH